eukprot:Hpha_TRINITY_DN2503_c0_g1::TRINITY_DN2503_c0_g1_i1::g.1516::m.1516
MCFCRSNTSPRSPQQLPLSTSQDAGLSTFSMSMRTEMPSGEGRDSSMRRNTDQSIRGFGSDGRDNGTRGAGGEGGDNARAIHSPSLLTVAPLIGMDTEEEGGKQGESEAVKEARERAASAEASTREISHRLRESSRTSDQLRRRAVAAEAEHDAVQQQLYETSRERAELRRQLAEATARPPLDQCAEEAERLADVAERTGVSEAASFQLLALRLREAACRLCEAIGARESDMRAPGLSPTRLGSTLSTQGELRAANEAITRYREEIGSLREQLDAAEERERMSTDETDTLRSELTGRDADVRALRASLSDARRGELQALQQLAALQTGAPPRAAADRSLSPDAGSWRASHPVAPPPEHDSPRRQSPHRS